MSCDSPKPFMPDLNKLQFVERIIEAYSTQFSKSTRYYTKYISTRVFKSCGLQTPKFNAQQLRGDQIFILMKPVYDGIFDKYKWQKIDYCSLADYLCAVLSNQYFDQGFGHVESKLYCPLGNCCKEWCVSLGIEQIKKCSKPGSYHQREAFMDHLSTTNCAYHYATYLLLFHKHNKNNGRKTLNTEENKRKRENSQPVTARTVRGGGGIVRAGRGESGGRWISRPNNNRPLFPVANSGHHSGEPSRRNTHSGAGGVSNNSNPRRLQKSNFK